jgi:hypothetical protein
MSIPMNMAETIAVRNMIASVKTQMQCQLGIRDTLVKLGNMALADQVHRVIVNRDNSAIALFSACAEDITDSLIQETKSEYTQLMGRIYEGRVPG